MIASPPEPYAGHWIDVLDHLPDPDITVLVYDEDLEDVRLAHWREDEESGELVFCDPFNTDDILPNPSLWTHVPFPKISEQPNSSSSANSEPSVVHH